MIFCVTSNISSEKFYQVVIYENTITDHKPGMWFVNQFDDNVCYS